jgi:hypothetical protein
MFADVKALIAWLLAASLWWPHNIAGNADDSIGW